MTDTDINELIKLLARVGPIVAVFDDSLMPLDTDARMDVAHAVTVDPTGHDARMHYVSLKTLIRCLQKLNLPKN